MRAVARNRIPIARRASRRPLRGCKTCRTIKTACVLIFRCPSRRNGLRLDQKARTQSPKAPKPPPTVKVAPPSPRAGRKTGTMSPKRKIQIVIYANAAQPVKHTLRRPGATIATGPDPLVDFVQGAASFVRDDPCFLRHILDSVSGSQAPIVM